MLCQFEKSKNANNVEKLDCVPMLASQQMLQRPVNIETSGCDEVNDVYRTFNKLGSIGRKNQPDDKFD
jgi:hypothetical protein